LKGIGFKEMFDWLSNSMSSVSSSSVGREFILPSINGWRISKIQTLINHIRDNGYTKRFNPRIYKSLGIEVDERQWIEIISILVRSGQFIEKLELTCPNCHEVINSYFKYQDIPFEQAISCINCDHEFEVSEKYIVLMYSFSEDFELKQELNELEKYSGILAKKD
jgi:DNA-directed RNA polymerase subunit M/transcription elongation factor TFIIS